MSAALKAALEGPGPDRVQVYGELWSLKTGTKLAGVAVEGGSITQDRSAAIRRSCTVTLASLDGLTPEEGVTGHNRSYGEGTYGSGTYGDYRRRYLRGLLLPLTTQLRLFQRCLLPGTTTWETIPLGRFTVTDPTFVDGDDGQTVRITGYDAAADIAAARWERAFVVADGTSVADALQALLSNRLPGISLATPSSGGDVTGQLIYAPGYGQGGDPWQDAQALAASAGWGLYIDRNGNAVAEKAASATTGTADWELRDTGTAQRFEQTPSGADLVNTVVVYAESSGSKPVTATVQDLNGPYGVNTIGRVVAIEYRSSSIKTLAQAQNAGIAQLRKRNVLTETIQITCAPAPHAEVGDLAAATSDVLELDDDLYQVNQLVFDLDWKTPTRVTVSRRM
ncbi:hypothetical protein [uncultured Friedmanniella sp.]|uniref:hypothetical protein n=1 Tax=uncultured Friedmanniella sp. TaxID=335381 RepID=UPI0035CC96A1